MLTSNYILIYDCSRENNENFFPDPMANPIVIKIRIESIIHHWKRSNGSRYV